MHSEQSQDFFFSSIRDGDVVAGGAGDVGDGVVAADDPGVGGENENGSNVGDGGDESSKLHM